MSYNIKISASDLIAIAENRNGESLSNALKSLETDPDGSIKDPGPNVNCDGYVNCNRHCLLIKINKESKEVSVVGIINRAKLHKLIVGWIKHKENLN